MVTIRQMRLVSYISVLLLITMYILPAAEAAKRKTNVDQAQKKTVLVFPFENASKSSIETFSDDLLDGMQAAVSSSGVFSALAYSDKLPSIQRAIRDLALKADDVKGPFGTDKEQVGKAVKLSREVAADLVLVGSVDDIQINAAANKAEVTLTAVLADASTGDSLRTLAITGQAPANNKATTEADLVALATGDAVTKLAKELVPEAQKIAAVQQETGSTANAPVVVKTQKSKKKSVLKKYIIPLVIGITVALIASSNNDNGDSEIIDTPPDNPFD
jgi:TolB-like protein